MINLDRLAGVIGMFDSPSIEERTSAFLRADQIIRNSGKQWRDVLPNIYTDASSGAGMRLSRVDGGHVHACLDLLRNNQSLLNSWEKMFLWSVAGFNRLTDRQADRLEVLMGEIELRQSLKTEFGDVY